MNNLPHVFKQRIYIQYIFLKLLFIQEFRSYSCYNYKSTSTLNAEKCTMIINIKKNNKFYNENFVTHQVLGTRFVFVKNLEIENIV